MADKELEHNDKQVPVQDEGSIIGDDVASRSLSDALRISFRILKIIILVLLVLFIASGVFRVESHEQALVLNFGKIRGDEYGQKILKSGLHWAWPSPIDEIVKIPVTKKQVLDVDSFWYFVSEREKETGRERSVRSSTPLDPTRDGYCLTRNTGLPGEGTDYSIVHSKWKMTYTINNLEDFFTNVYYRQPRPGEDFMDVMVENVEPMLETIASDAVVTTMVEYTIDEAIGHSALIATDVARRLQEKLDQMSSGIIVDSFQPEKIVWPRQVDEAFEASNKASQQSRKLITEAKSYAEKKLNEAGGIHARQVLKEIKSGSLTREEITAQLESLSGTSREQIAEAKAYKTTVVESAKANAEYLHSMLDEYRKNPDFVLQNIYQLMIEEVMENADEKIFVQPGDELRLMINRNPNIKKKAEEQKKED